MESDLIIEEGESVEESALPIERLVPLEQNQRRNRYGSIVCDESEGDEESNSVRSPELVSCKCKNTCSRKQSRTTPGCPCKNAGRKCGANCSCGTKQLQCKNGRQQSIETENAQRLPTNAFDRHKDDIAKSTEEIKNFVHELSAETREELLVVLLSQGKGSLDFARNILRESGDEQYDPELSMRQEDGQPEWCDCSHCVSMDNPEERKCCKLRNCITSYKLFENLCLDRNVLETAIKARCDIRADELDFGMNSYRKSAYRQYTLWRYGRLGKGNRRVCPACVVRMVRATYPSADGNYMGFRSS